MIKTSLLWILSFLSAAAWSQEVKMLQGRVVADGASAADIVVLNLNTEKEIRTAADGSFQIEAAVDHLLIFSGKQVDHQRKLVDQTDYDHGSIAIRMTGKITELEEVVIDNRLDAVSLGILSKPAKRYTPAERRLKAGTDLDAKANVGTMTGGSLSLDPLFNWLSGRTKKLKKSLTVERDGFNLQRLTDLYEDSYYTDTLKIDKDMIGGFRYYCIADPEFVSALKSGNKFLTAFLIGKIAAEYNNLQDDEK